LKRVEATTGCRVYIRGKGSIKDPDKVMNTNITYHVIYISKCIKDMVHFLIDLNTQLYFLYQLRLLLNFSILRKKNYVEDQAMSISMNLYTY
jgi:hypothetical protein